VSAGQQPDVPPPPESSGQGVSYQVDIRGPAVVGERNTVIYASYNYTHYQGTWTDGVAPPPLADDTGAMRESPYRGLAAFGEQDAEFFFGRRQAAGQVLDRMSQRLSPPGLLMVSGVSGAGKSSLLQAGVLPRIRTGGLADAPEAKSWPCLVLTPGREPLAGLASVATLASLDAATTHQALKADPADFALTACQVAEFQPASTSLPDQARAGRGRRLLLIVDQFEQLFTQCHDEEQRVAFLTALHAAATVGRGAGDRPAALVVLVVRADFEARCAEYPLLAEAVQNRYLVTAMTERELRMVITEPAKKAGSHVDEDLVTVLRDDIHSRVAGMTALEPGQGMAAPAGILPLLSHVLDTAWRARAGSSLTVADYENAGGIERAVADSAKRAYKRLTPAQKAAARTIFLRLTATSPYGTITADRATCAELLHGKNAAQAREVGAVLEAFTKERLLTLAADSVEISHEVLLRAWPLLRDKWLAGTEADRIVRTRLRAAASEWDRSGRDPAYLYAGTLLRDAATTVARAGRTRQPDPSPVEQEFLNASNRARRRTTTVRRRVLAVLVSLAVGLAAVAIVAYHASQDAARLNDGSISNQLVTESEAQADTNPTASKVEALAAWQIDATPQSRYALISAAVRPIPDALVGRIGPSLAGAVVFSRDGKVMATSSGYGTVQLWSVATQQEIGHPLRYSTLGGGTAMAFSPDSRTLATADSDGVRLWNVATRQQIGHLGDSATSVAFSPDGHILATGSIDGTVQLWNAATRQPIGQPITVNEGGLVVVEFSPDGKTLATADYDDTVRLWNVATEQEIGHPMTISNDSIDVVEFSPDGKTLATGDNQGHVRLWNMATQQEIGAPLTVSTAGDLNDDYVNAVAFSPDGKTLATGSEDDTVRLWNVATQRQIGKPISFTPASYPGFYTVTFSPGGRTLAFGLQDGMVWLWNVSTGGRSSLSLPPTASVAFSPNGQTLVTTDGADTARLWNVTTQQQIGKPLISDDGISSVAFSPEGKTLATSGVDSGTLRLWNVATQQIGQTITSHHGFNVLVEFSPDGHTLATAGDEVGGTVRLWNVATIHQQIGQTITMSEGDDIVGMDFSPDGKTLATSNGSGTVRLWNVATQQEIGRPMTISNGSIDGVAFSPDGKTLATSNGSGTVRLWNVATHQQIGQSLSYTSSSSVSSVVFSPDGQTLATADDDGTVRLWNVATQQQIGQPLTVSNGGVVAVAFRPDGRTLATASADGIDLWDVTPITDPLSQVCEQLGGSITPQEWSQYVPHGPAYSDSCT
jgi:WD40 repeat protein